MGDRELVLVIDDNEDDYRIIKRLLRNEFEVKHDFGENAKSIVGSIEALKPSCILLDYNLGSVKGLEMLKVLRETEAYMDISIIMLTNEVDPSVIVECVKNSAENYLIKDKITKPDLIIAVSHAINETKMRKQIREQQKEILRLSRVDELTGLLNRRYFIETTEMELARLERSDNIVSIVVMDLDHFKSVNDTYGHLVGDQVLKITAEVLSESFRKTDHICRYGGDEFMITMIEFRNVNIEDVVKSHLERLIEIKRDLCRRINAYLAGAEDISCEDHEVVRVTASFGMISHSGVDLKFSDLFRKADECLYTVKRSGRNGIAYIDAETNAPVLVSGCDSREV